MAEELLTIKGNWPAEPYGGHRTNWKVLDPYEARAVENLIGTIADLVQDAETEDALTALRNLADRFDTRSGDEPPYPAPIQAKPRQRGRKASSPLAAPV